MLLRRDVLIAEENNDIFGKSPMNLIDRPVRQGSCEINARDLCADDRGELIDIDRFIGLRRVARLPDAWTVLAAQRTHELSPAECCCQGW